MNDVQPTKRFTRRVEHYVRARPHYPVALRDWLNENLALTPDKRIADIGSGTGLLSILFLEAGNTVIGIEPNDAMRAAGETYLAEYQNFRSVNGSAEATTLDDASVDFVIAGQAFHWFDPDRARQEFLRILRPNGWVVLIWNTRRRPDSGFSEIYSNIIRNYTLDESIDHYKVVRDEDADILKRFFAPVKYRLHVEPNAQKLDLPSLNARALSSSNLPMENEAGGREMLEELRKAFDANQSDGVVTIDYQTKAYYGQLR